MLSTCLTNNFEKMNNDFFSNLLSSFLPFSNHSSLDLLPSLSHSKHDYNKNMNIFNELRNSILNILRNIKKYVSIIPFLSPNVFSSSSDNSVHFYFALFLTFKLISIMTNIFPHFFSDYLHLILPFIQIDSLNKNAESENENTNIGNDKLFIERKYKNEIVEELLNIIFSILNFNVRKYKVKSDALNENAEKDFLPTEICSSFATSSFLISLSDSAVIEEQLLFLINSNNNSKNLPLIFECLCINIEKFTHNYNIIFSLFLKNIIFLQKIQILRDVQNFNWKKDDVGNKIIPMCVDCRLFQNSNAFSSNPLLFQGSYANLKEPIPYVLVPPSSSHAFPLLSRFNFLFFPIPYVDYVHLKVLNYNKFVDNSKEKNIYEGLNNDFIDSRSSSSSNLLSSFLIPSTSLEKSIENSLLFISLLFKNCYKFISNHNDYLEKIRNTQPSETVTYSSSYSNSLFENITVHDMCRELCNNNGNIIYKEIIVKNRNEITQSKTNQYSSSMFYPLSFLSSLQLPLFLIKIFLFFSTFSDVKISSAAVLSIGNILTVCTNLLTTNFNQSGEISDNENLKHSIENKYKIKSRKKRESVR
jgi:hypothetical protein